MVKVFLIGNLTRDPELTTTAGGVDVCRFTVACNRRVDGEQTADFYNVTAWRKLGETVARYARKGHKLAVEGDLQIRQYEANDGSRRTAVDVIAQSVDFLTPKEQAGDTDAAKSASAKGYGQTRHKWADFEDDGDCPF